MKKIFYNWAPVLIYLTLILIFSTLPLHAPGHSDKVAHFFEFFLMGFLTTRGILLSFNPSRFAGILSGTLLAAAFGILDELYQLYIPARQASIADAIADSLGALVGSLCFVYLGVFLLKQGKVYPKENNETCRWEPSGK